MSDLDVLVPSKQLQDYLPDFYTNSRQMTAIMAAEQVEFDTGIVANINDIVAQNFVNTATWALATWEQMLGIKVDTSLSNDQRRQRLISKISFTVSTPMNVQQLQNVANAFVDTKNAIVAPGTAPYTFTVTIPAGSTNYFDDIIKSIEDAKPAHLSATITLSHLTIGGLNSLTIAQVNKISINSLSGA